MTKVAQERGTTPPPTWGKVRGLYAGKTVFVTGDTGLKGSWLSLWLSQLGAQVFGYALPPRTARDNYVVSGLGDVMDHTDGDVRDLDGLSRHLTQVRPDVVFHFAAQKVVLHSYREPVETFTTNVVGSVNVLEAVRRLSPAPAAVVVATSDKCYRNAQQERPHKEGDTLGGLDPYSASKAAAELVASSYRHAFLDPMGVGLATVRAGNVLGAGDWSPDGLIPDCMRALHGSRPLVLRHPQARRPWQYVLDALRGYLLLGGRLLAGDASMEGAWNLGPSAHASVTTLELVTEVMGRYDRDSSAIEMGCSEEPYEATCLHIDSSKANALLGWVPLVPLSELVDYVAAGYDIEGLSTEDVRSKRLRHIAHYESMVDARESQVPAPTA